MKRFLRSARQAVLILLALAAPTLVQADETAAPQAEQPAAVVAPVEAAAAPAIAEGSVAAEGEPVDGTELAPIEATEGGLGLSHDLSPWGMYQNADVVVKSVMIGLVIASVITWTIWLAKSIELLRARRRLKQDIQQLKSARTLHQASEAPSVPGSLGRVLLDDAAEELQLSARSTDKEAIKERVSFRLERLVAASSRQMSQGTGILATIGSTAPFVGLFGTVWGIMNSFIGIAKSQTTNLAVVAPGIAEALLATALGLVAAIPAVIIYNVFARSITAYRAMVGDACAQILLLVSRDMDHQPPADRQNAPHVVKVG